MRANTLWRTWGPAAVIALALAAAPAGAAGAQTYCVHQGGSCAAGQKDDGANLQKALDEAGEETGATILIGAGTYSHKQGFTYAHGTSGSGVTISGAGAGLTIIESSAVEPAPGYTLIFEADPTSMLSGVTIRVRTGDGGGLFLGGPTASGIALMTDAGGTGNQSAVSLGAGSTVEHSTIQGQAGPDCCATAIRDNSGGEGTLLDDTLVGYYGLSVAEPGTKVTARDLRIQARIGVIVAEGAATIDGALALLGPQSTESGLTVYNGGSLIMRSATVLGSGASTESRAMSIGESASKLTVQDSIVRGFAVPWERYTGSPTLKLENDDIAAAGENNGTGNPTLSANIDVDPLFVDPAAGDYHLRFDSPAIDSGGECLAVCLAVPDLDGLARPIDGNGDGAAVRDMGAYEYGHRAPSVTAAASTSTLLVGAPDAFTATAADLDPGDTVSLSWAFDDGAYVGGAEAAHAFTTPGAHTATVTATDSSGLAASATVIVDVRAAPTAAPVAKPDTKIRKAKISPSIGKATFTFGAVGSASGFQCELRRAHSDRKPKFAKCGSPRTYKHLKPGHYTFEVRALGAAGQDPTPAKHSFKLG